MKKQILTIALVLITVGLIVMTSSITLAQTAGEFAVPLTDPSKRCKIKAQINYGSIILKGTARKDILVKYKAGEEGDCEDCDHDHDSEGGRERKKDASKKDGMRKIGGGGMDLEVVENANFVKIHSDSWHNRLDLEIEIPLGADIEVSTYNDGDLNVSNVQGTVELTNYNGEITALNISGSVVASTYNGGIKVTFDKVTDGAPMSFSTFNGDVDLTLPATVKVTTKIKTEQGEIFSNFDIKFNNTGPVKKQNTQQGVTHIVIDDWKRGELNGGGAELTVKNYNGDIYLRKK